MDAGLELNQARCCGAYNQRVQSQSLVFAPAGAFENYPKGSIDPLHLCATQTGDSFIIIKVKVFSNNTAALTLKVIGWHLYSLQLASSTSS
jgi:hypothetical protein